jgi:CRP/FNR family transcriptional regulator, cyclic AMP receptor protein
MQRLERILKEHPFFASFDASHIQLLAGFAQNRRYAAGQYLFREGGPANEVFLIRDGTAALEIAAPGKAPAVFQTLAGGEIAGAAWLMPPYRWAFDARAVTPTEAIAIDAKCLRGQCDACHRLGYEIMKRFLLVFVQRLNASRLRFLDVYGR